MNALNANCTNHLFAYSEYVYHCETIKLSPLNKYHICMSVNIKNNREITDKIMFISISFFSLYTETLLSFFVLNSRVSKAI